MSRAGHVMAVAVLLWLAAAGQAAAKGGPSFLEGATIAGGGLAGPVEARISIPDGSYEMRALHAPANGLFADPFRLFVLYQTPMLYELVLHYDYDRYGGKQDKSGLYDGDRLIYFPNAGTWYEASPRLAKALRDEVFWGLAPANAQGIRGSAIDRYTHEILLGLALALLLTAGHHVWRGAGDIASPVEVNARLRERFPRPIDVRPGV